MKPKIICLDEPTSALDPLLSGHVASCIQQLADEGYIILVATHDIGLIEKLNATIHLMEDGKIAESAPVSQLMISPKKYNKISNFVAG